MLQHGDRATHSTPSSLYRSGLAFSVLMTTSDSSSTSYGSGTHCKVAPLANHHGLTPDSPVPCRSSSAEAPCRTRIALQPPIADPPTPTVSLVLPPTLNAEEQAELVYIFANPTPASIILTAEQDVPDPSTPFRFSGPRRVSEFLVPPQGERELVLRVVPTTPGQWILPRLRVWTVQHAQTQSAGGGLAKSQTANVTELEVDVEGDALVDIDPAQVELEDNLRTAREGDELASAGPRDGAPGRAPVVFVSPP